MADSIQIGFLGAGKMANALAKGFLKAGKVNTAGLIASDLFPAARISFASETGCRVVEGNLEVVRKSNVLIGSERSVVLVARADGDEWPVGRA